MPFEQVREEQLSEKELKWGYWWVTHKVMLRKIAVTLFIVVDVAFLSYSLYGFGDWLFISGVRERQQMSELLTHTANLEVLRATAVQSPMISDATVLSAGEGVYDIVAYAKNPNARRWLEVDYQFSLGDAMTPMRRAVILPGDTMPLFALGVHSVGRPAPQLKVTMAAYKIDPHQIRDYPTWARERLQFTVSAVEFLPPDVTASIAVSRARFTVKNESPYGYRDVGFFVTLGGGNGIVGANYLTIDRLGAGESRTMETSWFGDLPPVGTVDVKPDVNIFNDQVYLPVGN